MRVVDCEHNCSSHVLIKLHVPTKQRCSRYKDKGKEFESKWQIYCLIVEINLLRLGVDVYL